jgi:adenosylmethionine-8-amino-7-oxononanoate aminotransferase
MNGFVVVGTDTDAGKTTFCLQWLAAFGERFAYWKPVETGPSDSETVKRLVPSATVFPPLARYREAVAPELAAAREGRAIPGVAEIVAELGALRQPRWPSLSLIIETFGSALSPLAGDVLQAEIIDAIGWPIILVTPSVVGAIGRMLQAVAGLRDHAIRPTAVVLVGPRDEYAAEQIERHAGVSVFAIASQERWDERGIKSATDSNRPELVRLAEFIERTGPDIRVSKSSARSSELVRRDRASVWHPYTSLTDPDDPLPVVGADAEFLELADGRRLIDGVSSWWTILHGHRHPPLMAALHDAAAHFDHVLFAGVTHRPAVELAELLLATAPWPGGRVFYSDDGSTAVEVALKMAYQAWCHRGAPGRTLFVGFENAYHGDTFGAMAAGRDPTFFGRFEPLLFRTLRTPVEAERLAAALEEHRGQVAAVILEPLVQGAGGMQMHSPADLRAIADVAREHGVLFIVDEVMTGGGRTGSLWAFEQAGIKPDLICAGKTLTGGVLPLAATLASPDIVAAFDTADRSKAFFHGHSFTAHPLACAVAAANLRLLAEGQWRHDVTRIESFWRESLTPFAQRPGVREVRIRGSIVAVEIDVPGGYLAEVGRRMRRHCIERGVLLRPLGNVMYALPPYCTSQSSLARIAEAIKTSIAEVVIP